MRKGILDKDEWTPAISINELEFGQNVAVELKGQSVLICHAVDGIYAVANRCTHAVMPLEGGRIRGYHLTCPVHGARFDLRTGAASGLTQAPLKTFDTLTCGDRVFVRV